MSDYQRAPVLPQPRATLLIPDGGALATRVHYETLNDAVFLIRAMALSTGMCLITVVLLSLTTANVDIKLGIQAITTYPRLLFSSPVWSSTSVFSAIQVVWFMAYCVFSHIIRLHFNVSDPPRDWDDRNGEWSLIELDVRAAPKSDPTMLPSGSRLSTSAAAAAADDMSDAPAMLSQSTGRRSVAEQWKLCVLPTAHAAPGPRQAEIALLTPDPDYLAWTAAYKRKFI
ncbi:hypothetical protein GGI21_006081 [Coemansia aciculifera]|uniref:Uncharacterized protein n=1 Tax=Coemansia aciculifera TaxID=417176 RepID=A0ACC1M509_9FUNG|nr:hypothetical protein GGI21_006081 [Coemansia aciculifera]KAJ2894866.1 hypothetical protein IWW38_002455 [Coemansia aciculifera]